VQVKAPALAELDENVKVPVGGGVIQDHADVLAPLDLTVDHSSESPELLVAVP
jgi:hypothetical protein